jgi:secreted trypsin-like serine protease
VRIDNYTIHDGYITETDDNDVALLHLSSDILEDTSKYIQYAYLNTIRILNGKYLWAAGWGHIPGQKASPTQQYKVQVPVVPTDFCVATYPEKFCAGMGDGNDTCAGDSGSALVYKEPSISSRWIVTGITSTGTSAACGASGARGSYVNITNYIPWVRANAPSWSQPSESSANPTSNARIFQINVILLVLLLVLLIQ